MLTEKDLLKDMPKALGSCGFYLRYEFNGLWYCGYDNSVFHSSDRDLSTAIDKLSIKLKEAGYVIK